MGDKLKKTCTAGIVVGFGSIGRFHAEISDKRYGKLAIVDMNPRAQERARTLFPSSVGVLDLPSLDQIGWNWAESMVTVSTWGTDHLRTFNVLYGYGVKYVLCEKPLANSIKSANDIVGTAEANGIALGVHHHFRYSGLVSGVKTLSKQHDLGEPVSALVYGGANGIVTTGIHFLDVVCELFNDDPDSVISNVRGDLINPRSPDLEFYCGTATWEFDKQRQATFVFSNFSSAKWVFIIFYRDALLRIYPNLDLEIMARDASELEKFPAVTRTGEFTELVFKGSPPGLVGMNDRTEMLLDEIESGRVDRLPPRIAARSVENCVAALESGRLGRRVTLPIDLDSSTASFKWPMS